MKFTVDIDILASREKVIQIYMDRKHFNDWRFTAVDEKVLAGEPGRVGASIQLTRKIGNQVETVIETLESNSLPDDLTYTISAPQLWQRSRNSFIQSAPNKTTWIMENDFKCAGIHKVISLLAPGRFRKQSLQEMQRFKRFCEDKVYSEVVF